MSIREWSPDEEVAEITQMLHRAYAELAAMGLHYLATHQSDEVTRQRLQKGVGWVAEEDAKVVGTISLCPWTVLSNPVKDYQRPGLWLFHQFGVDPSWQRRGIGSQLLEVVENRARQERAAELACDTAESAHHLIALYERRGFTIIGRANFSDVNYQSVILSKTL